MAKGIRERHARSCRSSKGGRCDCTPTFQAYAWHPQEQRQVQRTFTDRSEAQGWVRDAKVAVRRGRTVQSGSEALSCAWERWLEQARSGVIRNRSGDSYKPSSLRGYVKAMDSRVLPALGAEPVDEVARADVQELVDRMVAEGCAPATVQTPVTALKAVYRHEMDRGRVKVNPTVGLRLPAVRSGRERIATPAEATRLLAELNDHDRAVWATAFYGGLRRGELRALRAQDIDLAGGEIHVVAGWDEREGRQPTKGRLRRKVPLIPTLEQVLADHLLRSERFGEQLTFGRDGVSPFEPGKLTRRADKAWKKAGLKRITPHECRHTFASVAIAAGVNIGTVSAAMGHASVKITWDTYHHLMPGTMAEAGALIQAYIARPEKEAQAGA